MLFSMPRIIQHSYNFFCYRCKSLRLLTIVYFEVSRAGCGFPAASGDSKKYDLFSNLFNKEILLFSLWIKKISKKCVLCLQCVICTISKII